MSFFNIYDIIFICFKEGETMRFFNTLTRKVEEFVPNEEGKVKIYTCGPTVYSYAHVGI